MQLLAQIILIIVMLYSFSAWIWFYVQAELEYRRGTLTFARAQAVDLFTFRVGLCGTIAAAALYIGG